MSLNTAPAISYLARKGCHVHVPGSGCCRRTDPNFTVTLPSLRWELESLVYHLVDDMDREDWLAIQSAVAVQFDPFVLANDTESNGGGWTRDWYFTNDPLRITGHNEADFKTILTRLLNSLRRAKVAAKSPYIAGAWGVAMQLAREYMDQLWSQVPQMFRDVDTGVLDPTSAREGAREFHRRFYDILDRGADAMGQQVYDYAQSRKVAAAPTPVPKSASSKRP